jgi:glycosyl-4,4'-diaponeurosporenoate acyltransferase
MIIEIKSAAVLIIANSLGWFSVIFLTGFLIHRIPVQLFDYRALLFRSFRWEREGKVYEDVFNIKVWKDFLPEGGGVFRGGFVKRKADTRSIRFLETFAKETCRAELVHWVIILLLPIFFVWNPPLGVLIMLPLVVVLNLPFIMIQRYNRPRLVKILNKKVQDSGS